MVTCQHRFLVRRGPDHIFASAIRPRRHHPALTRRKAFKVPKTRERTTNLSNGFPKPVMFAQTGTGERTLGIKSNQITIERPAPIYPRAARTEVNPSATRFTFIRKMVLNLTGVAVPTIAVSNSSVPCRGGFQ